MMLLGPSLSMARYGAEEMVERGWSKPRCPPKLKRITGPSFVADRTRNLIETEECHARLNPPYLAQNPEVDLGSFCISAVSGGNGSPGSAGGPEFVGVIGKLRVILPSSLGICLFENDGGRGYNPGIEFEDLPHRTTFDPSKGRPTP